MPASSAARARPARVHRMIGIVVSALLALTATATAAAPASAATKRTVTLAVAKSVVAGGKVTFQGKVSKSPKGTKVTIERKSGKKWVKVKTTKTKNAKGTYAVKVKLTKAGKATYRAKVAKGKSKGKTLRAATSKARTVTVKPKPTKRSVSLTASKAAVVVGDVVTLQGKASKSPKGTKVTIERKAGTTWTKVATVTTSNAKGTYASKVAVTTVGVTEFRATVARTTVKKKVLAAATSKSRKVTASAKASGGGMTLVSKTPAGLPGNNRSFLWSTRQGPSLSGDGRYTVFTSEASNLVTGDTNATWDVFLFDAVTDSVSLVSKGTNGKSANGSSNWPAISPDGSWVAFRSSASNLTTGTSPAFGVYLWSRATGKTELVAEYTNGSGGIPAVANGGRAVAFTDYASKDGVSFSQNVYHWARGGTVSLVSAAAGGGIPEGSSNQPSISADGRYVAYHAGAKGIDASDTNNYFDAYVWDRTSKKNTWLTKGFEFGGHTPAISANGRYVVYSAFISESDGPSRQIYLHDLQGGGRTLVSAAANGTGGNAASFYPYVSADGSFVAFESNATNLAQADTNDGMNGTDVFVWSRATKRNTMVSRTHTGGSVAVGNSLMAQVSDDGRFVSFGSYAVNLVPAPANANPYGNTYLWTR